MLKTRIKNLSQMDTIALQYLTKLRIISKIPENGHLDLTNNDLNIYTPTFLNWIYRKLQNDGKLNTIKYLKSFYIEVNGFIKELMKSIEVEQNEINKSRKLILLSSMAEKIKESTIGVDNLIKTYRDYHKIISTLESIQQDIINIQLKEIIVFIPDKYKTDILRDIEKSQYDIIPSSPLSTENKMHIPITPYNSPSKPIDIPGSHSSLEYQKDISQSMPNYPADEENNDEENNDDDELIPNPLDTNQRKKKKNKK